jgi:hypothetical protein
VTREAPGPSHPGASRASGSADPGVHLFEPPCTVFAGRTDPDRGHTEVSAARQFRTGAAPERVMLNSVFPYGDDLPQGWPAGATSPAITESRGSGVVLSSYQPIDRRIPHLQRGDSSPQPTWSTDLGFAAMTEVSQRDRGHDDMEGHQDDEDPAAWLPTTHGVDRTSATPPRTRRLRLMLRMDLGRPGTILPASFRTNPRWSHALPAARSGPFGRHPTRDRGPGTSRAAESSGWRPLPALPSGSKS